MTSRAERREDRRARVEAEFGPSLTETVLDMMELIELAWHDCYGESHPSVQVEDDLFACADRDLIMLIHAARLGVTDWRDLRVSADAARERIADTGRAPGAVAKEVGHLACRDLRA